MEQTVYRLHQEDLKKMIEKELQEGGYMNMTARAKVKIFLSQDEIHFLEDILSNVNPDNEKEKATLTSIIHMLKDSLVNT